MTNGALIGALRNAGEPLDPDREADRRDRLARAEPRQQAVVAAAGDQLPGGARTRIVQLEHEAGVVVEAAAERGREADAGDVDAARRQKAGAALEQVERGIEREVGVARERAQLGRRRVGIAADRREIVSISARVSLRQRALRAERRLLEEAVGDLADRAPADRGDAGDREQIGDQRMRAPSGRSRRAPPARPGIPAARARRTDRQAIEVVRERGFAVEVLDQPPLPRRRQVERGDQRGEQRDVADADRRAAASP